MAQKVLTTGIASGDEINHNFAVLFNKVGSNMSLEEYEVDKTGVNSSVRAISDFVADVGTGKANLPMAPGIYLIDRDYTIPSNINIVPEMGAVFYIASGVTLTAHCGIEAGLWQIFSGLGSVDGSLLVEEVYPEWWGAIGDDTNNDTSALQSFLDYIIPNHMDGVLASKTYKISAKLLFQQGFQWSLKGGSKTIIKQYANNTSILDLGGSGTTNESNSINISNIEFDYNELQDGKTNANCMYFSDMYYHSVFENLKFNGGYFGMKTKLNVIGAWGCTFNNLQFGSGLYGGAIDQSLTGNQGVPNNSYDRIFVDATNMVETVMSLYAYNTSIGVFECISLDKGVPLFEFKSGSVFSITAIKIENCTYLASTNIIKTLTN